MSWEEQLFALFDDLEQQAGALFAEEREWEVVDRSRAEYQQVLLAGRLMASLDTVVGVHVAGVGVVEGTLERVASGWCLLAGAGQEWIVRLDAVQAVDGASARAVPEVAWSPVARLGFTSALRRLAEAGERCLVHRLDGGRHEGVLRRAGADFVEVEQAGGRITLVAHAAIAAVQDRDGPPGPAGR